MASVENDEARGFSGSCRNVPVRLKLAHPFTVVDVHLTAIGLDERTSVRSLGARSQCWSAFDTPAVKFHAMIHEVKTKASRDAALQFLDFVVMKFDDFSGLQIDQVIVMLVRRSLIA